VTALATWEEGAVKGERLHETSVELEVPFHDVDALQVVWHGHYFKYFEHARTALLRSRGLDAGDLIGRRYGLVVIESRCRHTAPLRYGDRFRVSAWFRDFSRRLMIHYEVVDVARGRRAARGLTALATLNAAGELLLETPEEIVSRIRP
jgi:acyl-CoA thioester hydrolase